VRQSLARTLAGPVAVGAYPGFTEPDPGDGAARFISASLLLHGAAIAVLAIFASLAADLDVAPLHVQLLLEEEPPPPPPEPEPEPPVVPVPEPPPVAKPIPLPPPPVAKPAPPPPVPVAKPAPPPPPRRREPPPQIDQVSALPALVAPPTAPRPSPVREVRRSARPAPELAFAPGPDLSLPAAPAPSRSVRERPELPARRDRPRPPTAVVAAQPTRLAPPPPAATAPARPKPVRRSVAPPRPDPAALRRAPEAKPDIRGVALGSLAPCVTDARERELKQRVVASVKKRALCESPNGRFHLLETKNVNAFLMRIERAPGRAAGDRCRELALALDCLASR
jgi:hypothetical protein